MGSILGGWEAGTKFELRCSLSLRDSTYIFAFAALIDSTTRHHVPRHLDRRSIRRIVVALCGIGAGIAFWAAVSATHSALRIPVRALSAAGVILAVAQMTNDLIRVGSGLCGVRFADVHDHPYRSTSLSDFWSRRWNRTAARWFRQCAFLPARGAGVAAALFALFAVSGVMHAYLVAAVIPMPMDGRCVFSRAASVVARRAANESARLARDSRPGRGRSRR